MKDKKLVIGAINWDSSLPADTFFGYHSSKSLSPKKYRNITPYYADVLGDDKISYHKRTMVEYEREMQYAIDAGLDYFAYCWYGERPKKQEIDWQCNLWELSYARKMHSKSELKKQLKMCAILGVGAKEKELSDSEMKDLCEEMKEDYYQKMEGRPLVYVVEGHKNNVIELVKGACRECGTPEPYFVNMCTAPYVDDEETLALSDALSAYSFPKSAKNYEKFITYLLVDMAEKIKINPRVVPRFSLGWNPTPRIDNPVPWYGYPKEDYTENVTSDDIKNGAKRFGEWIEKNPKSLDLRHILIFAWNEFEEGAHICPTYDKEGKEIDKTRVETIREIIKEWKKEL